MKSLKQWITKLLPSLSKKKTLDRIDEASDESFPASDPPSWAGLEHKDSTAKYTTQDLNPIKVLKEEHKAIMNVIYLMHEQVELLQQNKMIEIDLLKNIITFMRQFVEKTHHQKEEKFLFPALEQTKAPLAECPLSAFKKDHESSHFLIANLEKLLPGCKNLDPSTRGKLIETLTQLKDIYTRHTLKEENYIFPWAEQYLSQEAQKSLSRQFEQLDHER